MKAITIRQPYAHLIVTGEKRIENRRWEPLYRGPIAIHAGLSRSRLLDDDWAEYPDMALGAIIGVVNLMACFLIGYLPSRSDPRWGWMRDHPHMHGPKCWVLEDAVRLLTAIPCTGRRGVFELTPEMSNRVLATMVEVKEST